MIVQLQGAPGAPLVTSPAHPVAKRGFTLVELIVMITLISILAFAALGRMPNLTVNLGAQADQLAADIRYVQSLSMTGGQRFRIDINVATNNYQIMTQAGVAVVHPVTGLAAPINLPAGVAISGTTFPQIIFDGRGQPYSDPVTLLAGNADTILSGGGESRTVRVNPNTGRVTVQ